MREVTGPMSPYVDRPDVMVDDQFDVVRAKQMAPHKISGVFQSDGKEPLARYVSAERLIALGGALPIAPGSWYLSGPMSGIAEHNFPAFNEAALTLRGMGFSIINPAETPHPDNTAWEVCLRRDLIDVVRCVGVIVLQGWMGSRGARMETAVAKALAMPIIRYEDALQGWIKP